MVVIVSRHDMTADTVSIMVGTVAGGANMGIVAMLWATAAIMDAASYFLWWWAIVIVIAILRGCRGTETQAPA